MKTKTKRFFSVIMVIAIVSTLCVTFAGCPDSNKNPTPKAVVLEDQNIGGLGLCGSYNYTLVGKAKGYYTGKIYFTSRNKAAYYYFDLDSPYSASTFTRLELFKKNKDKKQGLVDIVKTSGSNGSKRVVLANLDANTEYYLKYTIYKDKKTNSKVNLHLGVSMSGTNQCPYGRYNVPTNYSYSDNNGKHLNQSSIYVNLSKNSDMPIFSGYINRVDIHRMYLILGQLSTKPSGWKMAKDVGKALAECALSFVPGDKVLGYLIDSKEVVEKVLKTYEVIKQGAECMTDVFNSVNGTKVKATQLQESFKNQFMNAFGNCDVYDYTSGAYNRVGTLRNIGFKNFITKEYLLPFGVSFSVEEKGSGNYVFNFYTYADYNGGFTWIGYKGCFGVAYTLGEFAENFVATVN